ncbi:MAG: flippase [Thermoplasmata archaeon]|nr:MAG: flippase [Thermoplasmata archaeon]
MKNIANLMLKGSTWVFISRLVDGIVALLFSILLARMLGVDHYGFIGVTMGVVGLIGIFTHLGIPHATTKYVSESLAKKDKAQLKGFIYASLLLELIVGALLALVLFFSSDLLAEEVFHKPELGLFLRIASPIIFLGAISNTFMSTLVGYHNMRGFALINISNFLVRLVLAVLLVLLGFGVAGALLGFVFGWLVGSVLSVFYYLFIIRPHLKKIRPADVSSQSKKMLGFGIPMALSIGSIMIYEWVDKLVLAAYSPDIKYVSLYSIAFGMVALPLVISRSINTSFFPIVSALDAKKEKKKLRETYQSVVRLTMLILNPILVGMIVLAPQIIELLYGEQYNEAVYPFIILALWGFFRPAHTFGSSVLAGTGTPKTNAKVDGFTAGLNLCLNILLIPLFISMNRGYGPIGAALATTSSYIIGMSMMVHFANKRINVKLPLLHISKTLGAAVLSGFVMFVLMKGMISLSFGSGILTLLFALVLAFLIGFFYYVLLLSAFRAFKEEDIAILRNLEIPMKQRIISIFLRLKR